MGLKLNGATSGSIEIDVPAVAGTDTAITIPATSGGEFIVSDSSGNIDLGPLDINGGASDDSVNIDGSGRLLVGTSSARSPLTHESRLQVEGTDYSQSTVSIISNSSDASGPTLLLGKSRSGSLGGTTAVQDGDDLGQIYFLGADGSDLDSRAAVIKGEVDGTPGANDMPGRLVFQTTADGASSPTERMRLNNIGALKVRAIGAASVTNNDSASHELTTDRGGFEALYVTNRSANPFGIQVYHPTDANSTGSYFLQCYGSSTLRAGFRTNGGLANVQSNNVNISDINSKKDITLAAGTWDCIKKWEIVNYRYKDQPDDADLNLGVIAQQVAEGCPEVVTVFSEAKEAKAAVLDDDGNEVEPAQEAQPEKLGVKEQQMYWMAIKALQEAQTRIETLEAKVAQLEGGAA